MNCREFDQLLCDRLDGSVSAEIRREMDAHRIECSRCAEAFQEAEFAVAALAQAPPVEPPPELIAEIIHETVGVGSGSLEPATAGGGLRGWIGAFLNPFRQPRFVMGMAMTALSFSMLTFYGQRTWRQFDSQAELRTVPSIERFEDCVVSLWDQAVELAESVRDFYILQSEGVFDAEPDSQEPR